MARIGNSIVFPKLHAAQRKLYRERTRREVWRCGRRLGKTTLLEVIAGDEAIRATEKGLKIGWFAPTYKLNSPTFSRILNTIKPMVRDKNKTEMIINTETGGSIEFWTLADEDAGRSRSYDGVVIDEGSLVKKGLKDIWQQAIEPTLLDRRGWAIMAGTPKGIDPDNFFFEACDNKALGWAERHVPTWETPMLDPIGVAALVDEYPPLVYQQEFCADFVDWSGAAFFDKQKMLVDGEPVDYPERCDYVFAVIDTAVKTGKDNDGTAVSYYAVDMIAQRMGLHPMTILDWDIVKI